MSLFRFGHTVSFWLRKYPWTTNVIIGSSIGFSADIVAQIAVKKARLNENDFQLRNNSPLVVRCPKFLQFLSTSLRHENESQVVLIDLRRSLIFCSFTIAFNTYFFLSLYRRLDILIPPANVTKRAAIVKGFFSWIAANMTTPIYLSYVALLSHYFIHHTGRQQLVSSEGDNVGWTLNYSIFFEEVKKQLHRQLRVDWPDMIQYSLIFWGANWLPMFYYIPPHFRYLYGCSLQVVWSSVMSHLVHRGVETI